MSPMQGLLLREVERAGANGVTLERLEQLLENHREIRRLDPPKDPRLVVRVTINQINRTLLAAGKPRIANASGGDRRYRMERPYDAADDITKSVAEGFRAVRARMAAGGPGWGDAEAAAAASNQPAACKGNSK
jgi:hypothetical protein